MFQGLSFELESGTALTITGANGIGKSSLLRTLAGLVPLTGGSLRLEGGCDDVPPCDHMHYFGHQNAVKPALTTLENLSFWQRFLSPIDLEDIAIETLAPREALNLLGIGHTADLPAGYLSAGQTRRLALARLFVTPRPIWLMDEPTSALDKKSEALLLELMNKHLDKNGLIVTATHTDLALSKEKALHLAAEEPSEALLKGSL